MVENVKIVKSNGEVVNFRKDKIFKSCVRAGASTELCSKIADCVEGKVYDGMQTHEILSIIHSMLDEEDKTSGMRYVLRDSIFQLDSVNYEFEFFIARLLRYDGYETTRSPEPKVCGRCVDHEIDVVAKKDDETVIIECKHHYRDHTMTGLDVPMRQWARLEDINAGYSMRCRNSINATSAWVITNTKYSEHAVRYAKCKNVRLMGWNYPEGKGLSTLIEKYRAYPLTLVKLTHDERERLISKKMFNVLDFRDADDFILKRCGFEMRRITRIRNLIERLINSRVE